MSKITAALEVSVAEVQANTPADGVRATPRQRVAVDRAFARTPKLIAPRIRHFIRQYGLVGHWDDAEQCCAIAVHRAIAGYDPTKAQFTTFVNWQIRGELQSLRFRVMTDQRPSARKVEATTVSLSALSGSNNDGDETSLEGRLVDEDALERTESGAAAYLARAATQALIDAFVSAGRNAAIDQLRRAVPKRALAKAQVDGPRLKSAMTGLDPDAIERVNAKFARDREILELHVFGELEDQALDADLTREHIRQLGKRAAKVMAEITDAQPRFRIMADKLVAASAAAPQRDATRPEVPTAKVPSNVVPMRPAKIEQVAIAA